MKINSLSKLEKNISKVSGTHEYNLTEILSNKFIQTNTPFNDYQDLINKSGIKSDAKTFEELCDNEKLNKFIEEKTKFNNFHEMCVSASKEYITNQIFDI